MPEILDDADPSELEESSEIKRVARGKSADYERKKRHAESIIERKRLAEMLGFDVDFPDY
ncbi:hypothetical protein [Oceanobacter mangrovi]|uniref:hypothetical protein n=1 Tax=Oceanobacter mangrovi TaxID=2862510 RepID=UPI001C8F03CE|nr:hypothetical protein [Oceanobacter mangrovi]